MVNIFHNYEIKFMRHIFTKLFVNIGNNQAYHIPTDTNLSGKYLKDISLTEENKNIHHHINFDKFYTKLCHYTCSTKYLQHAARFSPTEDLQKYRGCRNYKRKYISSCIDTNLIETN